MMDKHDAVICLVQWLMYGGIALVVIIAGIGLMERGDKKHGNKKVSRVRKEVSLGRRSINTGVSAYRLLSNHTRTQQGS